MIEVFPVTLRANFPGTAGHKKAAHMQKTCCDIYTNFEKNAYLVRVHK
jgi:hypothetical protein